MRSIYIAGPMSGLPNNGYDAFNTKATQLRAAGWIVINPAEMDIEAGLDPDREFTRYDYMQAAKRDRDALDQGDAIYMLHGYEESPGGCWEWARAKQLDLDIYYETPLETRP